MSVESVPQVVGKYRPIALLGEGGMARVVLTLSSGPAGVRKLLVVKQIRPELARDSEFVTMFLDEARLAARLSHPNVIHTYEVGIEDTGPFIVMEYLDGQSMQALVAKIGRTNMPLGVHLRILTKALAGLHYAHELNDYNGTPLWVVHRDVSPQNVFTCYDGHVKVVDFGVAKVAGTADRTAAGTFKGKIGYIAPEQLSGGSVDRRADVFSVGVMLWEALAQRRMTANETATTVVHKRLHGMQARIKELVADTPDELAAICDRATAFAPEERFSTASEMQDALEAYLDKSDLPAEERDIAALVSQSFAPERLRISEIIEQQIGRASDRKAKIALPNLGADGTGGPNASPSVSPASSPPSFAVTRAEHGPSKRKRQLLLISALGTSAVVLALVARWWTAGRSSPPVAAPGASANAVSTAVPAESQNRTTVMLTIQVTPSRATLLLDGMPLPTNPFRSTVPRDSRVHRLTASAPGYVSEERLLEYGQDAIIDLVLKRMATRGAAPPLPMAPGSAALPGPAAPAPGSDLKKAPRGKTSIDEEDPYQ